MIYPEHLLPKETYRYIAWSSELLERYLLRVAPESDVIDPETQKVRARYVLGDGQGRDNLKDYSTNLFGIFALDDAAIQLTKNERKPYFAGDWIEGEKVDIPGELDFYVAEQFGYFFYKIATLHNFPEPVAILAKPQYTEARCYVRHTPTRANFWHFSVRWKVGPEDIEGALSKNERRELLSQVRTFLIENAVLEAPEELTNLPVHLYM